jgi:chromosome segregation ATPase
MGEMKYGPGPVCACGGMYGQHNGSCAATRVSADTKPLDEPLYPSDQYSIVVNNLRREIESLTAALAERDVEIKHLRAIADAAYETAVHMEKQRDEADARAEKAEAELAKLTADFDALFTKADQLGTAKDKAEAERDAARAEAAELRRLAKAFVEADKAIDKAAHTAPGYGSLLIDMQRKFNALAAHLTTTDKKNDF